MSWARAPPALNFGSTMRSKLNFTASALNGVPSWNFTSRRSLNVTLRPSADGLHDSASHGTSLPSGPRNSRFSVTEAMIWYVTADGEACGSSVGGSWSRPITSEPPVCAAAVETMPSTARARSADRIGRHLPPARAAPAANRPPHARVASSASRAIMLPPVAHGTLLAVRQIVPNLVPTLLVYATLFMANAILVEAAPVHGLRD